MLQLEELMSGCNGAASPELSQQYSCRSFTFTDDLKRCLESSLSSLVSSFSMPALVPRHDPNRDSSMAV